MSYITKTYLEIQFKNFAEKIKSLLNNKVDKVKGKGLSTNDLTSDLKNNYDTAYNHSQSTHARTDATKVEKSTTNGNIKINGTETTVYTHPTSDGSKHIPANGTSNGGKYLKATTTAGTYEWGSLTKSDVTDALGYTPYTPSKVDAELNSIYGDIFYLGVSTKKFTYTVYNQDTLKDWIENKSGNDYTSVLIKKVSYSYTITDINNFISVSKQGTLYIEGEEGSELNITYSSAMVNPNYFFIIGGDTKLEYAVSTTDCMSINNVDINLLINGLENSSEHYVSILKYANGISNCRFMVKAYECKQVTLSCYYGCTNLNNCIGDTNAEYPSQKFTPKTGYDRLRPFYSCSRVINSYAYGRNGYAGGAFYNGDHIINCNAKFENMYYGETFYNVSHVIGCRSYASVGTENGGSACAYKNCKKMLYNYASAGSYSGSYASADTNSTYLCANTLNGGWNS